jgi:hypothetical protein
MNALPKARRSAAKLPEEFEISSFKTLDPDRRVAEIKIGPILMGSVYITGAKTTAPNISWPRTARGYPIIVVDDPLRSEIEKALLARLRKGGR